MLTNMSFLEFQGCFTRKLAEMLSPDELGAFILVLANSMQDNSLRNRLKQSLDDMFLELQNKYLRKELQAAPDDLEVFTVLNDSGIQGYSAWQTRDLDYWRCAYNPLRFLRPARSSSESFQGLQQPFDEGRFHFDRAFLRPEILGEEIFQNTSLRILYHKFPFVAYHLLILPQASEHHAQFLTQSTHWLSCQLAEEAASGIPGFGLAFNSLGAGASVNHLHLHGYIQPELFSIEHQNWTHNGGVEAYPVSCEKFTSHEESWQTIEALHAQNQPYNLLYRADVCYVIPRLAQGECLLPEWMQTAVWHELCGGFNLSDRFVFESVSASEIQAGLECLRV